LTNIARLGWAEQVNLSQTEADIEAIRLSVRHGSPYGSKTWMQTTADQFGLQSTLRCRGRPYKKPTLRSIERHDMHAYIGHIA
jgi:hypothetical protein